MTLVKSVTSIVSSRFFLAVCCHQYNATARDNCSSSPAGPASWRFALLCRLMSGNFQEVVLNGAVEKKHLVESLHNRDKMRACAIFLLTIDSRSYEYWLVLGAEYQETMATEFISKEFNSMLPTAANSNIEARISWTIKVMGEGTAISRERKWALGLHIDPQMEEIEAKEVTVREVMKMSSSETQWFPMVSPIKTPSLRSSDLGSENKVIDLDKDKRNLCGSPNYAAPEVISGKLYADPEVDVWSCGVILYALLCNTLPFDDENIPNLFQKIKGGIYTLPSHLSALARDLIPRMLVVDPMKRMTLREICEHPWFQARLLRYLVVPPPDTMQQAKQIDEEILQEVVKMGFEKNQLVESLHNRRQNEGTVAYYFLLDNRFPAYSTGYLGVEYQETMESGLSRMSSTDTPTAAIKHRKPGYMDHQVEVNGKETTTLFKLLKSKKGDNYSIWMLSGFL
ncbi:LOW QUALITY PROTEIN: sperm motility kinase 2A-like [Asparagus officinalis]|uniref:LOW QUALITY PROTEIN: sperm motility kinase 2A-like n=1 Tax=Asparagus officinalis TaxID=4686 RepID=UPI00098E7F04|nr:LOW QUALITY PROTEIN: sperm motility kinase 2A-like [Asparagus officinalis]